MTFKPWTRCALTCAFAVAMTFFAYGLKTSAQSSPSSLPLLAEGSLSYLGGFRVPADAMAGANFTYGGSPIAFNPANHSLFVGNTDGKVAEISIPTPVNSVDAKAMPAATYLQPAFIDPTEGHLRDVSSSEVVLYGLMVYGNHLIGAASIYYDASYLQQVSHFSRPASLLQRSFSGWSQVWEPGRSGLVGGWMSAVPAEWQAQLGGPAITGQCCIPIVSRTSYGPAAFAFDPARVGEPTVPAQPLVYYDGTHQTLGRWEDQNERYGMTARVGGVAIIAGTRTALFIGSTGLGSPCYGKGTADQSLAGTPDPVDGGWWCYDPTDSSKGNHAYPYRYQAWAYDLNDWAAVKAGHKQPWEVVPYGVWPLTFPTQAPQLLIGGVGYDAQSQTLYVSQRHADQGQFSMSPVIHAFQVNPGVTSPSTGVSNVTLTTDKTAPQAVGTPITFTAQPSGGVAPYQYKWLIFDGVTSTVASDWTTNNRSVWTPNTANPNYRVDAWVRSAGNTANQPEALASAAFPIETSANPVTSLTVSANKNAPQRVGATIRFTANASGGDAPNQFKWLVTENGAWVTAAEWSTANTFTWTPSAPNSQYQIAVWGRSGRSTVDRAQALATMYFPIENDTRGNAVTAVTLTANRAAPQAPGTAITFSATASGGTGHNQFKWLVFDGAAWATRADWASAKTFTWTPASANSQYQVQVWARDGVNTADQPQAQATVRFSIEMPKAVTAPVSRLTVTSTPSPQPAGTALSFVATPVGGTAPYQYKWYTYDGASWTVRADWSSANTFTWTPMTPSNRYQIEVWVRSAGNTNHLLPEALVNVPIVITPR